MPYKHRKRCSSLSSASLSAIPGLRSCSIVPATVHSDPLFAPTPMGRLLSLASSSGHHCQHRTRTGLSKRVKPESPLCLACVTGPSEYLLHVPATHHGQILFCRLALTGPTALAHSLKVAATKRRLRRLNMRCGKMVKICAVAGSF